MTPPSESAPGLRRLAYALLIAVAAAQAAGRVLSAERLYEPSLFRPDDVAGDYRPAWPRTRPDPWPTFSSNDRSRWATVRALVDHGTYVVGRRDPARATPENKYGDEGIVFEDGWQTVDKVLNPDTREFYSSKPPLLATLVAGEYWLLKMTFGWSIVADRFTVIPFILLTINVAPLVVYLALLGRLADRFGATDWGRLYVLTAAGFGTMVTPFLITFNNHTLATFCVVFALYAALRIVRDHASPALFALAGFFAGFTACNELPATAFAVGLFVFLAWRDAGRALLYFAASALLPLAALLLTNYLELGRLRPAYAEFGGPWYLYEGSHWYDPGRVKHGIDWAGRVETKPTYAFHLLLGHHGIFSLMPVTLLALAGMVLGAWRLVRGWGREGAYSEGVQERNATEGEERNATEGVPYRPVGNALRGVPGVSPTALWNLVAAGTLLLSLVVVGFYVYKTDNYGGWSNGPRWLMWLTPLWLLAMLPVADRLGRCRWGRALGYALLALSVVSMSYQLWNPWRHPWIYTFMEARGWVRY